MIFPHGVETYPSFPQRCRRLVLPLVLFLANLFSTNTSTEILPLRDLQILIQEIARIALEDEATTQRIAHELGETEEKLQRVAGYLNSLLDPTNPTK